MNPEGNGGEESTESQEPARAGAEGGEQGSAQEFGHGRGEFFTSATAPRVDLMNWGRLLDEPGPRPHSSRMARPQ